MPSTFIKYSGYCLPPPERLRDYEAVLLGSAVRLIALAERRQKHRARVDGIAHAVGFILTLGVVSLSAYAASLGYAWESVVIIISWIAGASLSLISTIRS